MAKNVEPLKAKVRDMEKQQAKTTKLLADLNDQLGVLSKELGELDTNFKEKNEELTGLQTQAALMEKRLAAASKLITGLTGERTRWTSDIGDLNNSKVQLVGDCLLAASFLSYAGAFTSDFRAGMIYDTFAKKVCCGVLWPSMRLVSIRRGRGCFLFGFRGRSDRVERPRCSAHDVVAVTASTRPRERRRAS